MPVRYVLNRLRRFFVYRVLSLDDTPHRIALGVAIGIFVTWTPTIGFQMILTVALAWLLRANKLVGVPFVWISNPFTLVPIYGPNFLLGSWLLGGQYTWRQFDRAFHQAMAFHGVWYERVQAWWHAIWPIFMPLWLGSFLVGILLAILAYVLVYRAVLLFRLQRQLHEPAIHK